MIDPAVAAALRAGTVVFHLFLDMFLDSGRVRLWNGIGESPEYDGGTYAGVGLVGSIDFGTAQLSKADPEFDLVMPGAFIDQDGAPQSIDGFSDVVQESLTGTPLQNRRVKVQYFVLDEGRSVILHGPLIAASGFIDTVEVSEDERGAKTLRLAVKDNSVLSSRIAARYHGPSDHQAINPGSTYMAKAPRLKEANVLWGVESAR